MDRLWTPFREAESSEWLVSTVRRGARTRKALRPSDADVQKLLALRMHQDLPELDGGLERLQALGCIAWDDSDYPVVTQRGIEVLRRWLS